MIAHCRCIAIFIAALLIASCNSESPNSTTDAVLDDASMSLSPPAALTRIRRIDSDALFAEINLSYTSKNTGEQIQRTAIATRQSDNTNWVVALDIPVQSDFNLDIVWYDTADQQRVNLTQLSRTLNSGAENTTLVLTFPFSEYDSSKYNEDGDAFTNLEERENGTSPFSFDATATVPEETTPLADDQDSDADLIPNSTDNCPAVANPQQLNTDGDQQGDACDSDDDNDGTADASDCAPLDASISPTAIEIVDGLDNNCDNLVDNLPTNSVTSLTALPTCAVPTDGASIVCGEVLAADASTPIVGAAITLADLTLADANSNCVTDQLGQFACQLPDTYSTGNVNLNITAAGFEADLVNINATPGLIANTPVIVLQGVAQPDTTAPGQQNWLVQKGKFDSVQNLLAELKGCPDPENCTDKGLTVSSSVTNVDLNPFDVLFINCGADEFDKNFDDVLNATDAVGDLTRYRDFVNQGGHIYLTDLEAYVVEAMFPAKMQYKIGSNAATFGGTVLGKSVHPGLKSVVGPSFDITFDIGLWTPITMVEPGVTTFIEGDTSALSNIPGESPITIGFRPSPTSGCVFFSSYHIKDQPTGSTQEQAMKYLVQNVDKLCL